MDEPTAPPLDPSFFDFDNGTPLSKEELKGTSIDMGFIMRYNLLLAHSQN